MKRAAIYCRVSTEGQEQEGTSLQTQLEACQKYCQLNGYEVAYQLSEAWSGLSLERPKLAELREIVRSESIDFVVVYSLDRFSRDPYVRVVEFWFNKMSYCYSGQRFNYTRVRLLRDSFFFLLNS